MDPSDANGLNTILTEQFYETLFKNESVITGAEVS